MKSYQLPKKKDFEKMINGKKSHLIILRNRRGMEVALCDYGARVVSILVPDKEGRMIDVTLGFPSIDHYLEANEVYHGVTVGRFANRIAKGNFKLGDKSYHIKPNNGQNALHGGAGGFDKKVWDRRVNDAEKAEFYLVSNDGEEGFPGNLTVSVAYSINDENELVIKYRAETDATTVINLTNHAFFNLNGEGGESVTNHEVFLNSEVFLPVDEHQIPSGELRMVENTDFDFRKSKPLSEALKSADPQILDAKGIDHNYILKSEGLQEIAGRAFSPLTGIVVEVRTSEPGMQLYTGNFLDGSDIGKTGKNYGQYDAFCLETQKFPDSPNQPSFPSSVLEPGDVYRSETRYRFTVKK